MKKILFIIALFVLYGCASSRPLFTDPQTNITVYEAQCDGTYLTIGDCFVEASKVCPNGFITLTSKENDVGSYSMMNSNTSTNGFVNGMSKTYGSFNGNISPYNSLYGNNINGNFNSMTNSWENMSSYSNTNAYGFTSAIIKRNIVFACKPILETKQSVKTVK